MNSIRDAPKRLTRLNAPLTYNSGLWKNVNISLHTIMIKCKLQR